LKEEKKPDSDLNNNTRSFTLSLTI
jgi:hypothetical protein